MDRLRLLYPAAHGSTLDGVFERFTERARQVVVLAQEEARALRHNYVGTEHLLLGLLREEQGLAARVLGSLGVTSEEVRGQVARIIGHGDEVAGGQIPFTPRAKKVLELALREALSLGHNWIGTEHLLLGIARESDGVAMRILLDHGIDAERIRDEVVRTLGGPPPTGVAPRLVPSARGRGARRPRRLPAPYVAVIVGWLLFAIALGLGILLGWLIWG